MGREEKTVSIVGKIEKAGGRPAAGLPVQGKAERAGETSGESSPIGGVELDAIRKMAEILGGSWERMNPKRGR